MQILMHVNAYENEWVLFLLLYKKVKLLWNRITYLYFWSASVGH